MSNIPWYWQYSALAHKRKAFVGKPLASLTLLPHVTSLPQPSSHSSIAILADSPTRFDVRLLQPVLPLLQKTPLSRDEVGLFRALVDATREFGQSVSLVEHFFRSERFEQIMGHGWLVSYVYLCQQAKLYTPVVQGIADSIVGAAVGTGLGAISGGAVGFFVGLIKGIASVIMAALGQAATRAKIARISDETNRQIFYHLGPPPAILDDWLLHWHAFQSAQTIIVPKPRGKLTHEQYQIWGKWASGRKLEYGCLGLLQYVRERLVRFPPLQKAQIEVLSTRWTLPGHPVHFLDRSYMIDGPPWLGDLEHEPSDAFWKKRQSEGRALLDFYLQSGQDSMLAGQAVTPLFPVAKADLMKLNQLKQASGVT